MCNVMVESLNSVDFVVYSIIMNPYVTQKYNLPDNASIIKVLLWGTEEPSEHLTTPFSQVHTAKRFTDDRVVEDHFIPLFKSIYGNMTIKTVGKSLGNIPGQSIGVCFG